MRKLEKQVDALIRFCTAEDKASRDSALEHLRGLTGGHSAGYKKTVENETRNILLELGAPDHLSGHPYLVRGIVMAVENRGYINNIVGGLYADLAKEFETTCSRVERAIRHVIETTWNRGDLDVLEQYFGNTVDSNKGKPTNSEFLARIANVVRQRMEDAA